MFLIKCVLRGELSARELTNSLWQVILQFSKRQRVLKIFYLFLTEIVVVKNKLIIEKIKILFCHE